MAKEAAKKETLQEKLAKRKYRTPSRVVTWLYNVIGSSVLLPRYNPHYFSELPKGEKIKGPCIIVWNHLSRVDHLFTMKAAYPARYNMVAAYNEFFRSHLRMVFRLNQILPKKNFEQDIAGVKAISSVLRHGGIVTFSPEGMSSIYGVNQPVVPGSGRFIQFFRVPVYFLEMRGQYLTSTKHYLEERKGYTESHFRLLFTPEQLEAMSPAEIDDKLNEVFRHDEFEWTRERHIRWNMHGRSCEHLNEINYYCPRCHADLTMEAGGNSIRCTACGNGAVLNDYYEFEPFDDSCVIPVSPSKWVEEERVRIIDDIRADNNYSFSDKVGLGYLPPYKYVKHKRTTDPCGEGTLTFDHAGIHFDGTKLGEPWHFDLSYKIIYSLVIVTDTSKFALYVNGEFYEFSPERSSVGKMLLITEEMHRLHYNTWKNFPWNDWMYEGKELGIDRGQS
ncbi:MAG: 1-acyl-sn-glycerol-3-phosphate acyltransferase [Clostridia bacterium]|nr:1-acyl-sn-glycerol-3-phosphate acyltransferase [Clostridia bacterium]